MLSQLTSKPAMFKHILLPTDGSEASLKAIQKGAELAKALGASVTLMTAVERFSGGLISAASRSDDDPMVEAARAAGNHWLHSADSVLAKHDIKANHLAIEGRSVYESILEAAEKSGADLIVMGSHGAGALERLLVGSQTQRVLAHTNIPVLVLR